MAINLGRLIPRGAEIGLKFTLRLGSVIPTIKDAVLVFRIGVVSAAYQR